MVSLTCVQHADGDFLFMTINGDHLLPGTHINVVFGTQALWRGKEQILAFFYHATDVVG